MKSKTMSHLEAWDLIPWLVNGTLEADEKAQVEHHVRNCRDCAEELATQRQLAKIIGVSELEVQLQDAALRAIEDQLEPPRPERSMSWNWPSLPPFLVGFGGAVAAAVLLILIWVPQNQNFTTATNPPAIEQSMEVRIRFESEIPFEEIQKKLTALGAFNISAPSDSGVVRANFAKESRAEVLERLNEDPVFLFIATDEQ
jgi:hypothetical protein